MPESIASVRYVLVAAALVLSTAVAPPAGATGQVAPLDMDPSFVHEVTDQRPSPSLGPTPTGTLLDGTNETSEAVDDETTDSGTTDSGTTDSGTTDSGTTDSGTTDSGTADSETTDVGTIDDRTTDEVTVGETDGTDEVTDDSTAGTGDGTDETTDGSDGPTEDERDTTDDTLSGSTSDGTVETDATGPTESATTGSAETGTDSSTASTDDTSNPTSESNGTMEEATGEVGDAVNETNVTESATAAVTEDAPTAQPANATSGAVDEAGDRADELLGDAEGAVEDVTETVDRLTDVASEMLGVETDVDASLETDGTLSATVTLESDAHLEEASLRPDAGPTRASVPGLSDGDGTVDDGDSNETAGPGSAPTVGAAVPTLLQGIVETLGGPDVPDDGRPPVPRDLVVIGLAAALVAAGRRLLLSAPGSGLGHAAIRLVRTMGSTAPAGGWRDVVRFVLIRFGYRRYDDSDPLDHEARAAIYELVYETPGTYLSAISAETEIALSTVRYHLKILEFENLVVRRKLRGRRRYFPAGTEPSPLAAALADDGAGAVLGALADDGPASVSGLAEQLDRDPSTICYHLQQLAEDDLVERERDGPAVVNRLAPTASVALEGDD